MLVKQNVALSYNDVKEVGTPIEVQSVGESEHVEVDIEITYAQKLYEVLTNPLQ